MHFTPLTDDAIEQHIAHAAHALPVQGKRVLCIIPDATRTMPLPLYVNRLIKHLQGKARALHFLVALGTHPAMGEAALKALTGLDPLNGSHGGLDVRVFNHEWQNPAALAHLGTISAKEVHALSNGLLRMDVPVRVNKLVLEYDHILICGPVFPHEVVGFSGGNKYFFPGIAGPDIIDFTHWLGALITNYDIIGTMHTPVRAAVNKAASFIPTPRHALCSVLDHHGVYGVFFDTPEDAWLEAAKLSEHVHIKWMPRAYKRVLAILPEMYDELWVGGKGMYKSEPLISDGGEVVIYAPHLHEISVTHGARIREIGYHVRDYFVKQWDRFKHYPWGVVAHSTHVKGAGSFVDGVEHPRVNVTLATGLDAATCKSINLGYLDPRKVRLDEWKNDADAFVIERAGEFLFRVTPPGHTINNTLPLVPRPSM
jgi:nickel-dependent lactate racemase